MTLSDRGLVESAATPMSNRFIGLTLPAHDSSFSKRHGLLPVPAELKQVVTGEAARLVQHPGVGERPFEIPVSTLPVSFAGG